MEEDVNSVESQMAILESDDPERTAAAKRIEIIERELKARGATGITYSGQGTTVTWTFKDAQGTERSLSYDVGYPVAER